MVIILGIIGAYTLNDWSASRNRKTDEKKILAEIRSNLKLDLLDLEVNRNGHSNNIKILKELRNSDDLELSPEEVGMQLFRSFRDFIYTPQQSAIETLTSKGVDLISDDSLRIAILRLYDFYNSSLVKMEEQYPPSNFTIDFRYLQNNYYKKMDINGDSTEIEPVFEGSQWLQNQDVTIRIDRNLSQRRWLIIQYDQCITLVEQTIDQINEELNRL